MGELHPENLIPAKPGEVRNPHGKPPGTKDGIVACMRRWLAKNPNKATLAHLQANGFDLNPETTCADALAQVMITLGLHGDVQAFKAIIEYLEPKPTQGVRLEQMRFTVAPMPPPDADGDGFDDAVDSDGQE